jgi:hypothetical protein
MKLSLKSFIIEERQSTVAYTEKKAKNAIVKVIAELKGHDASVMSQLARRFDRLKVAIEKMAEMRDGLNKDIKGRVADLFDAEDTVLTRVVDTASFTMTLSAQATEGKTKVVVDWESIAKELVKLVPDELQSKIDEIQEAYTKANIMDIPAPGLRVDNKAAKAAAKAVSIEEGVIDTLKKLTSVFLKKISNWAWKFDKTLRKLEAELSKSAAPIHEAFGIKLADGKWVTTRFASMVGPVDSGLHVLTFPTQKKADDWLIMKGNSKDGKKFVDAEIKRAPSNTKV